MELPASTMCSRVGNRFFTRVDIMDKINTYDKFT